MDKPRLILADDHAVLLDGLIKLLPDFDVVGTASDGRSAVELWRQLRPDLIVLDIGLPLLNGIEAARQIKALAPAAKILFLTMHSDRVYLEEAFHSQASGYVLKQSAAVELVQAIRTVLEGGEYVSPGLHRELVGPSPQGMGSDLTPRQREVLQLISEGKAMKEIAHLLQISVRTVEFHKNSLMEQLGMHNTAELIRYAIEQGITHQSAGGRLSGL